MSQDIMKVVRSFEVRVEDKELLSSKQVDGHYRQGKACVTIEGSLVQTRIDIIEGKEFEKETRLGTVTIVLDLNKYETAEQFTCGQKLRVSITPVGDETEKEELFPDKFFDQQAVNPLEALVDTALDMLGDEDAGVGKASDTDEDDSAYSFSYQTRDEEIRELMRVVQQSLGDNTNAINRLILNLQAYSNQQK